MIFPVKKNMGNVQLPSLITGGYSISRRFLNTSPLNMQFSQPSIWNSLDFRRQGRKRRGRRKRWETKGRWQEGVSWTQKSRFDCNMIAAKMVEFQQFKAEIYPVPISQKSRCCWVHLCIVMQHEHHMLFKSREARLRVDSESSDKDHWSWLTWYTLW